MSIAAFSLTPAPPKERENRILRPGESKRGKSSCGGERGSLAQRESLVNASIFWLQ